MIYLKKVWFYSTANLSFYIGESFPRPIPTETGEWESAVFMNVRRFSSDLVNSSWANFSSMMNAWATNNYEKFNDSLTAFERSSQESIAQSKKFLEEKKKILDDKDKNIDSELQGLTA